MSEPDRLNQGASWPRSVVILLAGVLLVALVLRVVVGLTVNLGETGRLRGYDLYLTCAENLLEGRGLQFEYYFGLGPHWANRPPLYSLFLAGVRVVFGPSHLPILLLQSLIGVGAVFLLFLLGRQIRCSRLGLLAAAVLAFYPYAVVNDTTLVEQTLFTLLLLGFLLVVLREQSGPGGQFRARLGSAVAAGIVGGLAALTRETFLPFLGLALPVVLFAFGRAGFPRRLAWCAVCGLVFLAVCSPWLVRNQLRFGVPAYSIGTGKALWVGNNSYTFTRYPERSIDHSEGLAWFLLPEAKKAELRDAADEREQDLIFREMGLEYIREYPGEFFVSGIRKVIALFSPLMTPRSDSRTKNLVHLLTYGPVLLLAGIAVCFVWWRRAFALSLVFAALLSAVAVAFVFWGQTRLRASYDPLLILLAAGLFVRWRSASDE